MLWLARNKRPTTFVVFGNSICAPIRQLKQNAPNISIAQPCKSRRSAGVYVIWVVVSTDYSWLGGVGPRRQGGFRGDPVQCGRRGGTGKAQYWTTRTRETMNR